MGYDGLRWVTMDDDNCGQSTPSTLILPREYNIMQCSPRCISTVSSVVVVLMYQSFGEVAPDDKLIIKDDLISSDDN